jgi:hypothetical protein
VQREDAAKEYQKTSDSRIGEQLSSPQEWFARCPKASVLLEALEQCSSLRVYMGGKSAASFRLIEKLLAHWKEAGRPEITWQQSALPISDETYEEILIRLLP